MKTGQMDANNNKPLEPAPAIISQPHLKRLRNQHSLDESIAAHE